MVVVKLAGRVVVRSLAANPTTVISFSDVLSSSRILTPTVTSTQLVKVTEVSCLERTPGVVYCDHDARVYAICSSDEVAAPCMTLWPALEAFCQASIIAVPMQSTDVGPVDLSTVVVTVTEGTSTIPPTRSNL